MLLVGVLLVLAGGTLTGLLVAFNHAGGAQVAVTLFGHTLTHASPLETFAAGFAVATVVVVGCWLAASGVGRMRDRQAYVRDVEDRAAERDRLARELKQERIARQRAETLAGIDTSGAKVPQTGATFRPTTTFDRR